MKNCKTGIFYFSGTGNTLYIAKQITSRMKGSKIFSIPKELDSGDIDYNLETLGLIVPTYYLGLPQIVHKFIDEFRVQGVKYVFVIATKGWRISGGAVAQLKKKMRTKGIDMDYGVSLLMPFNDFNFGKVDSRTVQERKLKDCESKLYSIVEEISSRKKRIVFEPFCLMTPLRNPSFIEKVNSMDESFGVSNRCSGCGICEKVCPVHNIQMTPKSPKWKHKCQFCLACYNYCPTKAITFKSTNDQSTHYKHPKVTVKEMIEQAQ